VWHLHFAEIITEPTVNQAIQRQNKSRIVQYSMCDKL